MNGSIRPRVGVTVVATTKKVHTMKGLQRHRGFKARIQVPGQEPVDCCDFHQKAAAARRHGMKVGRALAKANGVEGPRPQS